MTMTTAASYSLTAILLMLPIGLTNAIEFDPSSPKYSCSSVGSTSSPFTATPLPISTLYGSSTILLEPVRNDHGGDGANKMCILSSWTTDLTTKSTTGEGYYVALGKSYDNEDWVRPPGNRERFVAYNCGTATNSGDNFSAGEYLCEVTLPMTSKVMATGALKELDAPYYLTYYERSLSVRNELSRFLQRTTIGPTASELDALEMAYLELGGGGSSSHAATMERLQTEWVQAQQDPSTFSTGKFSSLREYYRKRLNPRSPEVYRIGEAGPHPCEQHSRWRKFAFTAYDVVNSQYLRWGNNALGGFYQQQIPHKVTVETVKLSPSGVVTEGPTGSPSISGVVPTMSPVIARTVSPSISSAPTGTNIIPYGDMEGEESYITNRWPSKCTTNVVNINNTTDPSLVYSGEQSLYATGGRCFVMRQLGVCPSGRLEEAVNAGDLLRIAFMVKLMDPGQVFQVSTAHYHAGKERAWSFPDDHSNIIARTHIPNSNTWTKVVAYHRVGPDWTYGQPRTLLPPETCSAYQLRFMVSGSDSDFVLDDVRIEKVASPADTAALSEAPPVIGFISNPKFEYNHAHYMFSRSSGYVKYDPDIRQNAMVLPRGKVLRQNIVDTAKEDETYMFSFLMKLVNVESVNLRIVLRMRFNNTDVENGPCQKEVCNFFRRALARDIGATKENNGWQRVITSKVQMFGNYTEWNGNVDFILMQLFPSEPLPEGGEILIADFQEEDPEVITFAPSVSTSPSSSPTNLVEPDVAYIVRYAGEIRTVMRHPFQVDLTGEILPMDGSRGYNLCDADEVEGRLADFPNRLSIMYKENCVRLRGGNPTVDLDPTFLSHDDLNILDLSSSPVVPINVEQTYGGDWLLQASVDSDVCAALPTPYDNDYRGADPLNPDLIPSRFSPDKPVFALLPDGTHALYDPRLIVRENTIENPLIDGGGDAVIRTTLRKNNFVANSLSNGTDADYFVYNDKNIALCSNDEPNYINVDHCILSYEENACLSDRNSFVDVSLAITFNEDSLAKVNIASNRSIYAVANLRFDETNTGGTTTDAPTAYLQLPCMDRHPRSRWIPRPDLDASTCLNSLQPQSVEMLKRSLEISNDENPFLRDVILWNNRDEEGCATEDKLAFGMLIMTSEGCWENVHPNYMSIYDFSDYVTLHPSSPSDMASANGILVYPDIHPMNYWEDLKYSVNTTYVTRYGDKEIVDQFADTLGLDQDPDVLVAIAQSTGKIMVKNKIKQSRGAGVLVCGSPNEVASDPFEDDYFDVVNQDADCIGCLDAYGDYFAQKQSVWTMVLLGAEDQLCQKMAWALYELINTGTATDPHNTESNLYVYDSYTRNCFGNYFDIMKEMLYSPKMAEQFNFAMSSSQRFQKVLKNTTIYPDENFAREIMQLYTIGLHELNDDGTPKRDKFGRVIRTYTNEDILSNARIFTGWDYTARRGNTEVLFRSHKSRMEPMRLRVNRHDFFPKSSVAGGWIGDRYPLCADLPKHHFLKIGARFRLLGGGSQPRFHYNHPGWEGDEGIRRFVLEKDSALYQKLCNPNGSGECQFANTVTLDVNIPCYGRECRVDTLIVVQVAPGTFYEYIRKACVQLSFYNGAKKIFSGVGPYLPELDTRQYTHSMCADPRLEEASRICCIGGIGQYSYKFEYHGELVNYATNEEQCLGDGGTMCDPLVLRAFTYRMASTRTKYNSLDPDTNLFFWTSDPCEQQIKVRSDGLIAFVHKPKYNPEVYDDTVPYVDYDFASTFIKLPWQKDPVTHEEVFPTIDNTCGNGVCTPTHDDMCLCGVTATDTPVFASVPSRADALATLKIGAHNPALFSDAGVTYSLLESTGEVDAYVASDAATIFATSTIFKVTNEFGETIFLKNMQSSISLGATVYEMRNPPSFINLVSMTERDFDYEVDAFLTDLIRYESTAPHVSKRLTQVFGTSNPSPSYVRRVTQAFRSGTFTKGGITFGDGKYGSLAAVAAAITLDPEFMSVVGDEDPTAGQLREPLLKVMAFLRSMEFKRKPNVKFRHGLFQDMHFKIGQMVFQPPDQFSFFDPGFSPPGVLGATDLVSPEAEVLTMTSITGLINGFFSLNTWGLTHAGNGWGTYLTKVSPVGDVSSSVGYVTYKGVGDDIYARIDDLSTLLTAGRLSPENKQVLADAHSYFTQHYGPDRGDRVMIELLSTTPEFHSTNTIRKTGLPRTLTPQPMSTSTDYKAIVYVDLFGGADSFNILTPHPDGGCYLYDDYYTARGGVKGIGLTLDDMVPIDGSSAGIAGCTKMGVHKKMSVYKDIFAEGSGIFFANMGHLHKPVNKDNWITETQTDLFSHTSMKRESHRVDAFLEASGPGVLGRMLDILQVKGHVVAATSMDRKTQMIDGNPSVGRLADVVASSGPKTLYEREFMNWRDGTDELRPYLEELHSETVENAGMFGNMWSQTFLDVWNKAEILTLSLKTTHLMTEFSSPTDVGDINKSLRIVAEMIAGRNKRVDGLNRDVFYIQLRGFDHHAEVKQGLDLSLPSLNKGLRNFWNEIKAQGIQNNVLVIQGSEFGRTISPNSNSGSDHGWGGNYFIFGGDVKGGQIFGEYPRSFSEADATNIGRGRVMPTTSWEALWYGVNQWFGIDTPSDVEDVIPNSRNFGCNLFSSTDLFHSGTGTVAGCGGPSFTTEVSFNLDEPRYLTGEEQKLICDLAVDISADRLSTAEEDIRCYIGDQIIVATADGGYIVQGDAVLNFDYTINESKLNGGLAQRIAKTAQSYASDFVVAGAASVSEAPSSSPSSRPPTLTPYPTARPTTVSPTTHQPTNSTVTVVDPSLATQEYCKSHIHKDACELTGLACEWDQRFKGTCYLKGTAPNPDTCVTNNKPCPALPNQCCTGVCEVTLNRCN